MSGPTQHPLPDPTYFPCSRARSAFPTPCLRSSHGRSLHSSRAYTHRCGIASDELKDAARKWVDKLTVKNGAYAPDAFPNPGEICHWPRCDGPTLSSMPFSHRFHPLDRPAGAPQLCRTTMPSWRLVHSARNSTPHRLRTRRSRNTIGCTRSSAHCFLIALSLI